MGPDHHAEVSMEEARRTASLVGSHEMTTAVLVVAEEAEVVLEVGGNVQAMAVTVDMEDAMTRPHVNGIDKIVLC